MKCLTVRQPWAWAMFEAGKDVENRSWSTNYRGPLAIHVSKRLINTELNDAVDFMRRMTMPTKNLLMTRKMLEGQLGHIIGVVDLVDCLGGCAESGSQWAIPGQYHWVLVNPRRARPVPIVGQLGLFECPVELEVAA